MTRDETAEVWPDEKDCWSAWWYLPDTIQHAGTIRSSLQKTYVHVGPTGEWRFVFLSLTINHSSVG